MRKPFIEKKRFLRRSPVRVGLWGAKSRRCRPGNIVARASKRELVMHMLQSKTCLAVFLSRALPFFRVSDHLLGGCAGDGFEHPNWHIVFETALVG